MELRDAYAGASCVVVPLRPPDYPLGTEGSGLTALLEAMAAARPVIARRVGALPETVVHGETGLLIDDDRPESVAQALETILGDPATASPGSRPNSWRRSASVTVCCCIARGFSPTSNDAAMNATARLSATVWLSWSNSWLH
jgi:glycosyltransferase involved in cell wall biosynthesis